MYKNGPRNARVIIENISGCFAATGMPQQSTLDIGLVKHEVAYIV